jgi:glycosyltransferase involved in cell wall biosynthesis
VPENSAAGWISCEAVKPLLVDPSGRGGIVRYTRALARALCAAGVGPILLANRGIPDRKDDYRIRRWLPKQRWGRPRRVTAWPRFYAGRAFAWLLSALAVRLAICLERPDVVHFQAPINRRLDATLLQSVRRHAAVVWTVHDVLPAEPAPGDSRRFALIYQAADVIVVHGQAAAEDVQRLAGVEPMILEHVPFDTVRLDRSDARRRLGLPDGERILGAIGFVRPYKGYDLLADVWQRLAETAPLLLVVGEPVGDEARGVLGRLQRSGRVVVRPGYASDDDLQLAFSAVDALLLPYVSASESGLLHIARAVGLPVFASDTPQLEAAVRAMGGAAILRRDVDQWAEAVLGPLPEPPSPPPSADAVGRAHVHAYEEALRRARGRRRGSILHRR